ncbi:MAG: hypothetical protein ACJA2E_002573 [Arenicella sp.]|jgi:hypothetical protein
MRKSQNNRVNDPLLQQCEDIIRSSAFSEQPFFDPTKARGFLDSLTKMDRDGVDQSSLLILRMASMSLMQQRFGIST